MTLYYYEKVTIVALKRSALQINHPRTINKSRREVFLSEVYLLTMLTNELVENKEQFKFESSALFVSFWFLKAFGLLRAFGFTVKFI